LSISEPSEFAEVLNHAAREKSPVPKSVEVSACVAAVTKPFDAVPLNTSPYPLVPLVHPTLLRVRLLL